MKRPVIIGVKGEASELVKASGGGVSIEPEDENDFVANLVKMKESPATRVAMGESGRNFILKGFDRSILAGQYLEILRQLSPK
jgi:glycosyltransferase involved in cell wall biosynthesis